MTPLDVARAGKQWGIVHVIENECGEVVTQTPLHNTDDQEELGNRTTVSNLDAADENGWTRLHVAASEGDSVTAQYLINAGANLHATDKNDMTPLYIASFWNNAEVAQVLINAGANLHATDEDGKTPLDTASLRDNAEVAQVLINAGA
ncbi:MAG: hypothetical protein TE42_00910 [Candidatus Synechococcus spongiarum SP3]|uniref:Uncharacterized protein n=1 Tax=Candidatus Synechococcus spongiarum SP3 TaxID=1604020 RepID=A0A0G2HMV9_9SYNE|nr:MAG: hypothetical protein TE42_00910 [Candidatus Synechococcus spongiarum SP3]